MNNLYFKKYISIYKTLDKICIGFVGKKDEYLEIQHSKQNLDLLENLLKNGIQQNELKKELYSALQNKKFLISETIHSTNSRSELFLEYLSQSNYDKTFLQKKILIFGAGAGGSSLIYMLAQFGFKNLYVIDYDIVQKEDINRVTIFVKKDINRKKIEVLKDRVFENFSNNLKILDANLTHYEDLESVIQNCSPDLIVKACDPKGLFLKNLNLLCFKYEIPYMMMAYSYESIKIGPLIIPNVTSCSESISNYGVKKYGEHYRVEYFERLFGDYLFHPSVSFNINILSSLVLKEIIFFLKEDFQYCQTIGRLLIFNPLNFKSHSIQMICEDCNVCNNDRTISKK